MGWGGISSIGASPYPKILSPFRAQRLFILCDMIMEQFYAKRSGAIFNAVKSADKRADVANWFGREKLVFLRTNKFAT